MTITPVTASDLLGDLTSQSVTPTTLRTAVHTIDRLLGDGLELAKVTEFWGPPGSGRTCLGLTIASGVLRHGKQVIWLACAHPLSSSRVTTKETQWQSMHHIHPPTLTHLIAFVQSPSSFQPVFECDLLVIDDLSSLVDLEYPRQSTFTTSSDSELRKWQASRRSGILASIVTYLNRLAIAHNIAVLVLNGCATTSRSHSGRSATLVGAIGGLEWEAGIWCRLALFRDFHGRFAALQRSRGSNVPASSFLDHLAQFEIGEGGLAEDAGQRPRARDNTKSEVIVVRSNKRKLDEIADSDDELDEYGWNADEELEVQIIE